MTVGAPGPAGSAVMAGRPLVAWPAPVEYAVAVDHYLADAPLGPSSRRVYRISLTSWTWPLVGLPAPAGRQRRGARPPVVPLALLDDDDAGRRLDAALADRSRQADIRTVNRELSALRSAVGWWQDLGWIARDPTTSLRPLHGPAQPAAPLTDQQLAALFRAHVGLREQALWHLLRDTGIAAPTALALDAASIGRTARAAGPAPMAAAGLTACSERTSELLAWLLSGRSLGPVFLTDRRASGRTPPADLCPLTGRARMSYRRAAEIFAATTRPLDPCGHGWMLHQVRPAEHAHIKQRA